MKFFAGECTQIALSRYGHDNCSPIEKVALKVAIKVKTERDYSADLMSNGIKQ
jgi:hypothetical protein